MKVTTKKIDKKKFEPYVLEIEILRHGDSVTLYSSIGLALDLIKNESAKGDHTKLALETLNEIRKSVIL